MNYIFCHNCGAENENTAKFCKYCGVELKKLEIQDKKIYEPIDSSKVKQPIMKASKPGVGVDKTFSSKNPKLCCYAGCLSCVLCIPFIILFAFISNYFYSVGSGSQIITMGCLALGFILPCLVSLLIVQYIQYKKYFG